MLAGCTSWVGHFRISPPPPRNLCGHLHSLPLLGKLSIGQNCSKMHWEWCEKVFGVHLHFICEHYDDDWVRLAGSQRTHARTHAHTKVDEQLCVCVSFRILRYTRVESWSTAHQANVSSLTKRSSNCLVTTGNHFTFILCAAIVTLFTHCWKH